MRIFLDNNGVSTLWSQFKAKLAMHTDAREIHVTAAEKAGWNAKADLSDIPLSLPADGGNADTVDGKHASDFALKTDIPTALPANGGTANTARETVSPNAKARLWEDSEGGNLHLASPDGNHSVEMDLYNNSFRMAFIDNGEMALPVDYSPTTKKFNINGNADTVDGKHASDFALKTDIPTTLPANGGRSDSTNHQINHYLGQGIDVLTYAASDNCPHNVNTKVRIMHCPTCPTNYGYNAADNDFWYDIYKIDNSWVQIKAYDVRGNVEFLNSCINGKWSGWARSADGGNANTANLAGSFSSTSTNVCLRNLSSGTADVTTTNCPRGAWYGKHS